MSYISGWPTKAELLEYLLRDHFNSPPREVHNAPRSGDRYESEHWILAADGFLMVFLVGAPATGEGWGFKDMSTRDGPRAHACPESMLREASSDSFIGYGLEWLTTWGKRNGKMPVVHEIRQKLIAADPQFTRKM
jgi:hypothetical protein